MKIVHVVDYLMPEIGYQEFLLPKWQAKQGDEVVIICADRYAPIPDYDNTWFHVLGDRMVGSSEKKIENVTIVRLKTTEVFRRPWLHRLTKRVQALSPDVVFCHGTASFSAFRLAFQKTALNAALVMDNHQCFIAARKGFIGSLYYYFLKHLSQAILNPKVDLFFGVATECCDFMKRRQGILEEKTDLLPLGVDTDIFKFDAHKRKHKRSQYDIPEDALVVMQTGKLDASRKPEWLASAMNEVFKKYDHTYLVYVGQKTETVELKVKACVDTVFHGRIRFVSFVPQWELSAYFSMSDICVYPDSSSLSCFEAASNACCVILNDLPASAERADDGIGIMYRRGDIGDLQAHLIALIESESYRQEIINRARAVVLEKYSYKTIASQCTQKINSLFALRSVGGR